MPGRTAWGKDVGVMNAAVYCFSLKCECRDRALEGKQGLFLVCVSQTEGEQNRRQLRKDCRRQGYL